MAMSEASKGENKNEYDFIPKDSGIRPFASERGIFTQCLVQNSEKGELAKYCRSQARLSAR